MRSATNTTNTTNTSILLASIVFGWTFPAFASAAFDGQLSTNSAGSVDAVLAVRHEASFDIGTLATTAEFRCTLISRKGAGCAGGGLFCWRHQLFDEHGLSFTYDLDLSASTIDGLSGSLGAELGFKYHALYTFVAAGIDVAGAGSLNIGAEVSADVTYLAISMAFSPADGSVTIGCAAGVRLDLP
ncbi:MAG: hypothetical protein U1E65_04960 [Myxococcota bacterium]